VLEKLQNFPNKLKVKKELQKFLGLLTYISNEGFIKTLQPKGNYFSRSLRRTQFGLGPKIMKQLLPN